MPVLQNVLATTIERSRKKLIVAAMQSNALMAWCFARDRIENESSGYNITNPLLTGRNPTVGSYQLLRQPTSCTDPRVYQVRV